MTVIDQRPSYIEYDDNHITKCFYSDPQRSGSVPNIATVPFSAPPAATDKLKDRFSFSEWLAPEEKGRLRYLFIFLFAQHFVKCPFSF